MKKRLIIVLSFIAFFQINADDDLDDGYVLVKSNQYQDKIKTVADAINAFQKEVKQECQNSCWVAFLMGNGKSCCGKIGYEKLKEKWIEISDPARPEGGFAHGSYGSLFDIGFGLK